MQAEFHALHRLREGTASSYLLAGKCVKNFVSRELLEDIRGKIHVIRSFMVRRSGTAVTRPYN